MDAALKAAEPLQLFEFTCGYEVPAHPTVAGNCDRLALRLFLLVAGTDPIYLHRDASNRRHGGWTRALAIEAQVLLHAKRNFDGDVRVMGRTVRNRCYRNLLASIRFRIRVINGENNGTRPILAPLDLNRPDLPNRLRVNIRFSPPPAAP